VAFDAYQEVFCRMVAAADYCARLIEDADSVLANHVLTEHDKRPLPCWRGDVRPGGSCSSTQGLWNSTTLRAVTRWVGVGDAGRSPSGRRSPVAASSATAFAGSAGQRGAARAWLNRTFSGIAVLFQ
jgi:hypothetical protein